MRHLSQPTLTHDVQRAILRATACNPRDHLICSLAPGTCLRPAEIVGLDVGDVYTPEGRPRDRLRIRPELARGGRTGDDSLPDALTGKLRNFWAHKATLREGLKPGAPAFCSQSRVRIGKRRVQFAFRTLQVKTGFDRLYPFHCLRHTMITNVYRASRDLFLAQRFARHVSPLTTMIYTHPSDEALFERVRTSPVDGAH